MSTNLPYTFADGDCPTASEMNANFNYLCGQLGDYLDTPLTEAQTGGRLDAIEAKCELLQELVSEHTDQIGDLEAKCEQLLADVADLQDRVDALENP